MSKKVLTLFSTARVRYNPLKPPTMKKVLYVLSSVIVFSACDKLAPEREDVVRFDYAIHTSDTVIVMNDTIIRPYETNELKQYKDERENIELFEINKIEFRFYTFRADHDSNKVQGTANFRSEAGTLFEMELFEIGNEYKDSENHELKRLTADGVEGAEAYDKLAQEIVNSDQVFVDMGNLSVTPDSLDCDLSIYFHYTIRAQ